MPIIGELGYDQILKTLGPLMVPLRRAYGADCDRLLRAQYRKDRKDQRELAKTLRQGVRVGLHKDNAEALANFLGVGAVDGAALNEAVNCLTSLASNDSDPKLPDVHRNVLGRFELAVDARIDAALALAQDKYVGLIRLLASVVSVAIALAVGYQLHQRFVALIVGIAAVPIAPIANDVVGALQSVKKALEARR
jgi:hypothetical protein